MNDVLIKWRPHLDTTKFDLIGVSPEVKSGFLEFVECCHAVEHWKKEEQECKSSAKNSMLKKHEKETWLRAAKEANTYQYRARFLAAELAFKHFHSCKSPEDIDLWHNVFERTRLSTSDTVRGHETANFELFAVNSYPIGN